jgi:hypothetical protein
MLAFQKTAILQKRENNKIFIKAEVPNLLAHTSPLTSVAPPYWYK